MKRFLAGILSAVLLMGSIPVYGAQDMGISPEAGYSVEGTELSQTEEALSGENVPQETADTSNEENVEENQKENTEETPAPSEEEPDSQEPEIEPEVPEEPEITEIPEEDPEITETPSEDDSLELEFNDGEVQIEDAGEEASDYLENLTVYTSQNSNAPETILKPERREDLDEAFGGKVYTVEYGSYATSSSFYLSGDIGDSAPEGSSWSMKALLLNGGENVQEDMNPKAYTEGVRYRMNGRTFGNGANGAKRAVYTITAGTEETYQTYKLVVLRRLDLSYIGCYLPEDEDLAKNLIPGQFDSTKREYEVAVGSGTESLNLVANAYSGSYYGLTVNGVAYEGNRQEIPLTGEETEIILQMNQEETYLDPEYAGQTYVSEGTYHIRVTRQKSSSVAFEVSPDNAVVSLYDQNGDRVVPAGGTGWNFENLLMWDTYTWTVSCYGYKTQTGSFVAGDTDNIRAELESIDSSQPEITDNDWINYRNSDTNNGVTDVAAPSSGAESVQKWAMQLGGDWNAAVTPPLILGGTLYVASGKYIYKIDRATGEILAVSEELAGSMVFALNPLTYAEGVLFAQIGGGQIQAVSATTLKSLWISESVGGQTLSPITYKDGYIYTGTWNSETTAGTYFALSVTDEDPSRGDEIKYCTWKYSHKGGFYWAGAYASGDYLVFGSDDGSAEGNYTNTSILYSVSTSTGVMLDKLTGLKGDIRTSVAYNNGYVYFATKGGYLYRVKMNQDGTFGQVLGYNLGGMATATPVIYKGRIYIGVCGQGGQFNPDGGHHFDVLTESEDALSLAYSVPVAGYPQAAPLLSTAYEKEDYNKDGKADGRVYVYFTANAYPGGIYMLEDSPGQTEGKAEEIFTPDTAQQQYSISTLCVDRDGTIYYKNDSNYLMAIEKNGAYLSGVSVSADTGKVTWNKTFRKDRLSYDLILEEGAEQAVFSFEAPEGVSISVDGKKCDGTYKVPFDGTGTSIQVQVSKGNKSRTYVFNITGDESSPLLKNLAVSTSNSYTDDTGYLALEPAFTQERYEYTAEMYNGKNEFLNIFVEPQEDDASVTAEGIRGTKKINNYGHTAGSGSASRIAVYFGEEEAEAAVKVTVKTKSGKTASYQVILQRRDIYPPKLSDARAVRYDAERVRITFASNEMGNYQYKIVKLGETPEFDLSGSVELMTRGQNSLDLMIPETEEREIWILAKDIAGNQMSTPVKIPVTEYKEIPITIKTVPADAGVRVTNQDGEELKTQNGKYMFLKGNVYKIEISRKGYETLTETVTADPKVTSYSFTLKSLMSSDAYLKYLYVSSADHYGKGIQKLEPSFKKMEDHYTAVYGDERQSLNVWTEAADAHGSIKVYAMSGILGSSVQKDETILQTGTDEGHPFWKILFASGEKEAKIRIQVTAEDGTRKNVYLTLRLTDKTAPVLKKVSASRISTDKASVVYKTSEKGYRYYKVVDAGKKIPVVDTSGKGTEVQAGTDTITLTGLISGQKDVVIAVKDGSGNVSQQLVIRIPDIKNAGSGTGNNDNNSSVIHRPGSGGHKSEAGRPGSGSDGNGSKANLKKVSGTGSSGQAGEKNGTSTDQKKTGSKGKKKDAGKSEDQKKADEKKSGTSGKSSGKKAETTDGSSSSDTGSNGDSLEDAGNPEGQTVTAQLADDWKGMGNFSKLLIILAVLIAGYLSFWYRARKYYKKKLLTSRRKPYAATKRYR